MEAAFQGRRQEQVNLAHEIPVLILYGTAIAKENGEVFFFEDIYGYDKAMGNCSTSLRVKKLSRWATLSPSL